MEKKDNSNISNDMEEKKSKSNGIVVVLVLMFIIVLIITLVALGYAKYIEIYKGLLNVESAKIVCEMEVTPSKANEEIINPYCIVIVKNYNDSDKVTETDVKYTIEVKAKGDIELPQYYWEDANGTIIAKSAEINGTFENGNKKQDEYKIVFINPGEQDIMREIEFNLFAIQGTE